MLVTIIKAAFTGKNIKLKFPPDTLKDAFVSGKKSLKIPLVEYHLKLSKNYIAYFLTYFGIIHAEVAIYYQY